MRAAGVMRAGVPMVSLLRDPACECPSGAIDGAIDGDVKIALDILYDHVRRPGHGDLDAAAFVLATARPVEIRKPDGNPPDVVVGPVESEAQAPLDVLAQAWREVKASGLNDDLHGSAPAVLDGEVSLGHRKTSAKSNIIY